jgi:hypothetical protein
VTLAELLVATALASAVLAGVFTAMSPVQAALATEQEAVDLQQRVRVAVDALTRDLRTAASVRPYRTGLVGDDARAGVFFRADTITVRFPPSLPGARVTDPSRTYYLKHVEDAAQLMRYDGSESTLPVLDDVVGLGFEYFGDPQPPRALNPPGDPAMAVTYGPAPPPLTTDDAADAWGPGENCTFAAAGGAQMSRLPSLPGTAPVALGSALLTDGPWCPDAASADRFDADLLRVRLIRVRLRLQAPRPFRGPAGVLFMNPGTAADARRYVPDQEIRVDASPRNWNGPP